VNFIDTADAYGPNVSEELIAAALHPYPAGLVIGTKGGIVRPSPPEWVADSSPKHLREACHGSLKRLRLDRIDLYQLHAVDDDVPLADSIGELAKLQQEGKIRYIGVSNVTASELALARSMVKIVSVQNRYNVATRGSQDVLEVCERDGIVFIPHTPLARRAQASGTRDARVDALVRVAQQRGVSTAQAALAWLLRKSRAMLPIPGTSSIGHLEENVAAAALQLTPQEMASIG
jgi:aryl-alcohol dehydrogenase-like predicted oxidoreductase